MVAVPLGMDAFKRNAAFGPEARLLNLYMEEDKTGVSPDGFIRVQRPGLSPLYDLGSATRGVGFRLTTNELMIAAGDGLYSGDVRKGTIAGAGIAPMVATTFTFATLGGTTVYLYDTTVAALAMPDDRVVQDIDQLNQYVLLLCPDGRFYWLVPGETVVDALNFATAESSADKALAIRRVGDEFWIFGSETVEVWQPTGDADAPFQPVSGRQYGKGCLARDTVRRFDNSLMWVTDDCQVARGGSVPEIVSDNGIAERIRKRAGEPSAWVFKAEGHEFYVLRIPGQGVFSYDALTRKWCEFSWSVLVGYQQNGTTYAGALDSGKVWTVNPDLGTDDGALIERVVSATIPLMGQTPRNDSLSVGIGCSEDCTIRVRWKDGQDDFPDVYDEIDVQAPFDVATIYRLGQPQQPYRTIEISCVETARISIAGCVVNQSWQ